MKQQPAPHSIEAEEALLGSLLIDPSTHRDTRASVNPEDFFQAKNRYLYEAILKCNGTSDTVTLMDELERQGNLEEVGGIARLVNLMNRVPSALHAPGYARTVREMARRRRVIVEATALAKCAYDLGGDIETQVGQITNRLTHGAGNGGGAVSVAAVADTLYERVQHYAANPLRPGEVRGTSTGLLDLDRLLGGLEAGLYIVGAATHVGKTALMANIAANVASAGGRVLFFTLEMTADQLLERMVCSSAKVSRREFRAGRLQPDALARLLDCQGQIAGWPLMISAGKTSMQAITAEVYRHLPLDLVVIDWMGLVTGTASPRPHEALGEVARWALALAQDAEVSAPVLLPQQVSSKALAGRGNKRPQMGDLYKSDEPNQSADVILLLHRDDRWTHGDETSENPHVMEIACWKDRLNGEGTGSRADVWFGDYADIGNLEKSPPPVGLDTVSWME